jgi:protease prsW family protein
MECSTCRSANPEAARYCFRCGTILRGEDGSKRGSAYAIQASENVTQFALISTIMPHTNRRAADSYRWALLVTGGLVLALTLTGILPGAILAAAFLVPLTYLVYLYDVNLWEDQPISVIVGLFLLTGALATLISLVFFQWVFDGQLRLLAVAGRDARGGGYPIGALLIFSVLLPVVAEFAKNIGPLALASRPQFDDMIDGLTFGVAAGTAYAAFETVVAFAPLFTLEQIRTTDNLGTWVLIILNLMVVKSLIYGTATGIATAAYSGLGEGYDGFTPRYIASFLFAVAMNVLYWVGLRLFDLTSFGAGLGLLWGLAILAVLVIRVRLMLHTALLEAAVEDAARGAGGRREAAGGTCSECEMPLLPASLFCIVCGTSVRASSHQSQRAMRSTAEGGAA